MPAWGERSRAVPRRHFLPHSNPLCPPNMAASPRQRLLLPPQARSTAGHPSCRAQRALEEKGKPRLAARPPSAPPPRRPGGGRGPGSRRRGRGTEKMAAAPMGREGGPQHSRPSPRTAPPHHERNGSDARRNPHPSPAPRGRGRERGC